jgi:G3E family GTPase
VPDLSVVIVGGLHADARRATVAHLLHDVPGSVVLHHDLATAAAGTVVRTIRDATGIVSAGETPLVNDCACCALREDLVPELRRLAAAGQVRLAVVELWDSVEPKAMAEVVTAGGLTVTGVITAVDPALLLPYLGNGDDLAAVGLAAAATDQRTVADTFARQLEYAPVLAVLDSENADDEDRELLGQLHPTARQVALGERRSANTNPEGASPPWTHEPGTPATGPLAPGAPGCEELGWGTSGSEPPGSGVSWFGAPGPGSSGQGSPGSGSPGPGSPGSDESGARAAGTPVLGSGAPRTPARGESVPGSGAPRTPASGMAVPAVPASGTAVPGTPAPGEPVPGTPAPGAPALGTPAPGTPAPGEPVPGMPASGEPAPGTPTPRTPTPTPTPPPTSPLVRAALAGFDVEAAAAAQHPACALLPVEADACGVTTFVWHRCRPFHPERLYDALEDLTCAAARSRGRFWLADKPDSLLHWDAAGGALCVESAGPWLASLPDAAWELVPPVRRAAAALDWHPEHGDCCQHLVFTSPGLDRDGLERLLESCLLTDTEYAAGRTAWKRFPPAFDAFLEI